MAKKKKKGVKTPEQLREEAKQYSAKAKSNFKEAGKAFIHGSHQGVRSLYGAAKGAIKAVPLGDKTPILKGAWNGFWDTEPFKEGTKDIGKFYGGIAKGMANGAMSKQLNKQAKRVEFMNRLKNELKNDLSWYNNYPESTMKMIGPNFNTRTGIYEPLYDLNSATKYKMGLPSCASVSLILTRGCDTNSSVTASINRLYTSIRQANSGSVNWSPYQLDAYIFNYRLIIALYSVANRALKYLNKYSVTDKNVPQALFAALGFDYDDIANNSANMRTFLTNLKVRLSGYAIPNLDVLKRTYWLFSNGFHDSDDTKHQTYFVIPCISKYYHTQTNSLGVFSGSIKFDPTMSSAMLGHNFSTIRSLLVELLQEFESYDIYSIISGDIVKAFGVDSLFKLEPIAEVGMLPTEGYSEEFLQQLQNIYLPRTVGGSGDLTQSLSHVNTGDVGLTETITYTDTTYQTNPMYANDHTLINMYKNEITNLDVLGATRFVAMATQDGANYTLASYGTEIFNDIRYIYYDYGTYGYKYHVYFMKAGSLLVFNVTTADTVEESGRLDALWSAFDWSPRIIKKINYYLSGASTTTATIGGTLFDINNYAKFDTIDQLQAIHDVAIQSLYYSPLLSRVNNNVEEYGN